MHCLRIIDNLSVKQDDFSKAGLLPSLTITPVMNVIFLVIIAAGVLNDYPAVPRYFADAIAAAAVNYDVAWRWLQDASTQVLSLIS